MKTKHFARGYFNLAIIKKKSVFVSHALLMSVVMIFLGVLVFPGVSHAGSVSYYYCDEDTPSATGTHDYCTSYPRYITISASTNTDIYKPTDPMTVTVTITFTGAYTKGDGSGQVSVCAVNGANCFGGRITTDSANVSRTITMPSIPDSTSAIGGINYISLSASGAAFGTISIPYTVDNPKCGVVSSSVDAPTSGLCSYGAPSIPVSNGAYWNWTCGDSNKICSTPIPASCGSADGQSFTSAPTSNLCHTGSVDYLPTGSGPWNWNCISGVYGMPEVPCSANQSYSCSSCSSIYSYANATYFSSDPSCSVANIIGSPTYSLSCACGAQASDPFNFTPSCAAPTPTCNALTFNAANSSATPASVTADGTYTAQCDYNQAGTDGINVQNDLGGCTWTGWNGTAALFSCNAGSSGTRTNTCYLATGTSSKLCGQSNPINSVSVTCVQNNPGCGANICTGGQCNNGCSLENGTKTTGECCISNKCEANTCTGSTCNNNCTATAPGTKNCATSPNISSWREVAP